MLGLAFHQCSGVRLYRVKHAKLPTVPYFLTLLQMMAELSISDVRRMYELTMGVPAYACGVLKDGVVLPGK